jgi:superfamily II DNA or RNA helicase
MQRLSYLTPSAIKVPSPIERDYGWPGMFQPFDHQRDTSRFLTLNKRAFCFNEAGTGKTSAAIWAADYLMNQGIVKRVLVVCPLSIMQSAWQADLFKTAMHRTCGIAHGTTSKRKKIINGLYDFVIINYDGVGVMEKEIIGKFDLIIIDEANAYKTTSTKRWRTLARSTDQGYVPLDDDRHTCIAVTRRCVWACQAHKPQRSATLCLRLERHRNAPNNQVQVGSKT